MDYPAEPNAIGPMGAWLKRLLRAAISHRILPGPGIQLRRTPAGTFLGLTPGGGGTFKIQTYLYVSMFSDYLICHTWDGTTEGTEDIKIAKPTKLQQNVEAEDIDGAQITYEYVPGGGQGNDQFRSASDGTFSEYQAITPRYLDGDLIFAMELPFTQIDASDNSELNLIDINVDARAWAGINNFAN